MFDWRALSHAALSLENFRGRRLGMTFIMPNGRSPNIMISPTAPNCHSTSDYLWSDVLVLAKSRKWVGTLKVNEKQQMQWKLTGTYPNNCRIVCFVLTRYWKVTRSMISTSAFFFASSFFYDSCRTSATGIANYPVVLIIIYSHQCCIV